MNRRRTGRRREHLLLSVVAPCFNEQDGISEFVRRVTDVSQAAVGSRYEILLINDGSRDATWPTIQRLAAEHRNITAINLSRNYGHQVALTAGLRYCRGEKVLIIDSDLQDRPELLPEMLKVMETAKADVVYGQRRARSGETFHKKATAAVFYRLLQKLIDFDIPIDTGDFRLMSRRAVEALNGMPEQHRFIRGMVSWIGFAQIAFPYDREPRFAGKTGYPYGKMIRFALDAITSFSIVPLRIASGLGALLGVGALIVLFYAMMRWFEGRVVQGWTSLVIVDMIAASMQLFILGMIGEYLGRLYIESKRRPLFIIESIIRPLNEAGIGPVRQSIEASEEAPFAQAR